jgi:undecaprenyl pyrophosphate synthase
LREIPENPHPPLIVRWRGGRRLSGFLPVHRITWTFHVVDDYCPDFELAHLSTCSGLESRTEPWAGEQQGNV